MAAVKRKPLNRDDIPHSDEAEETMRMAPAPSKKKQEQEQEPKQQSPVADPTDEAFDDTDD